VFWRVVTRWSIPLASSTTSFVLTLIIVCEGGTCG
jgi:hypothetical protein